MTAGSAATDATTGLAPAGSFDPAMAVTLFAVDPLGCGLALRGTPDALREPILAFLANCRKLKRLPLHVAVDRLTGGLDVAASLAAGCSVMQPGVLFDMAGGVVVLSTAERWSGIAAALVAAELDAGRLGLVALDESDQDEALTAILADRCAYVVQMQPAPPMSLPTPVQVSLAHAMLPQVTISDALIEALCAAAIALGTGSMRGVLLATRAARAAAAFLGRREVSAEDAALAARLVLGPRATRLPVSDTEPAPQDEQPAEDAPSEVKGADDEEAGITPPDDLVLDAAKATLPQWLLEGLKQPAQRQAGRTAGRAGAEAGLQARGRPAGNRAGQPRDGNRLDLIATLRIAAPWQRLRGRARNDQRLMLRRDDLRVLRCRPRARTTTIFAVDASGSLALARLAEAKGAVELLLADCYVRRDQVAVIAFRGTTASVLLAPTRAPARARRALAGLPGGGGTPIALGLDAATALADAARRRGETPTIVVLTDGQANIDRAGAPGRAAAQQDALQAAAVLRSRGHRCLLIDTSQRPQPLARSLATAMGGQYLALPRADAVAVSQAVRASRA